MKQTSFHTIPNLARYMIVSAIIIILLLSGCTVPKSEGFAIYLTKEDITPARMEVLSHVDITEQPIISTRDIITYNAQTHELKLTEDAFQRIARLDVPVRGKSFVVCVDKAPVYCGAFWTPISSMSFDGVTIWKPLGSEKINVITIELGYPSSSFYRGEDPRNSTEIMRSLDQAGKLVNKLSTSSLSQLLHSMKRLLYKFGLGLIIIFVL